jgi:hypothetical protein
MEIVEETLLKAQFERERRLIGSIMVLCTLCFSTATIAHIVFFWQNADANHLIGALLCSSVLILGIGLSNLKRITFEQWLDDTPTIDNSHEKGP